MKNIEMIYLAHFNDCSGKPKERLDMEGETINDLIDTLEDRYHGIGRLLRKENGKHMPQNVVILYREGERAKFMYDFTTPLQDGDQITLL